MQNHLSSRTVAIACGGTGGHLFPGLAVAAQLVKQKCAVTLLISPKDVDQHVFRGIKSEIKTKSKIQSAVADETRSDQADFRLNHNLNLDLEPNPLSAMEAVTLPAVALSRGRLFAFVRGFTQSYRAVKKRFRSHPPDAVLAMGGFTAAPPILAGRRCGATTFLHESNTIPGRANRWLARVVDQAFVGFAETAPRLHNRNVTVTGTPVRAQFRPLDPAKCRTALGLDPNRPVLLVMGGSQGASGINHLVVQSLPLLAQFAPDLQYFHLTGQNESEKVKQAVAGLKVKAILHPFFESMELALGAATVAISRAGASSLAELAAMRVPAVLIPFPAAAANHQFHNARAFEATGAARLLEQKSATPGSLSQLILKLTGNGPIRERMREALGQWHRPAAAEEIAGQMIRAMNHEPSALANTPASAQLARLERHQSATP